MGKARVQRAHRDDFSLRELVRALADRRWTLVSLTAAALVVAAVYLFGARPVHRATMSLKAEDIDTFGSKIEGLAPLVDGDPSTEGDIQLLRSRTVLGSVVDERGLDVVAEPLRFPVLGDGFARGYHDATPAAPPFGPSRYGWGGERIVVTRLTVPETLLGRSLTLTATEPGAYRLALASGEVLLDGRVGVPASAARDAGTVELLVAELVARPGTKFRIRRVTRDDAIDTLQTGLWIEEKVKDSGIISVTLDGHDPARLASILSTLSSVYLRRDVERRSAEAAKRLEFLEGQLPRLKARLDAAEELLAAYRTDHGTVSVPWETHKAAEWSSAVDAALAALEAQRGVIERRYTPRHPEVVALDRSIAAAREKRAKLDPRLGAIPPVEIGAARLAREVNMAADLYLLLSKQAETVRLAKAGTIGHVRLLDAPVVSPRPVRPRPVSVVILALFVGLGGGVALIVTRRAFDEAASDSRQIETATGLPVLAIVPHSGREANLGRRGCAGREPLARDAPDDPATESLRLLRTALAFAQKARGNVVAVSSPSPGVGKTFVSVNLAHLVAAAAKRVLLVDGDLRRGTVHRFFSVEASPGLSEVLARTTPLEQAARSTGVAGLDVLPCGERRREAAELLASTDIQALLAAAAERYDLVVVDTPPSLAVSDALIVARHASSNLLVLRAGRHPMREIALALERYVRSGVVVHGVILNDTRPLPSKYERERAYAGAASGA
jgi:tyrosine-protein kinase Etk/Wzc